VNNPWKAYTWTTEGLGVSTKKVMTKRLRALGCNKMSEVVFIGKVCFWQCGDFKIYYRTDICVCVCVCMCVCVCVSVLYLIFRITCWDKETNIY
jgi:hypothetical protein